MSGAAQASRRVAAPPGAEDRLAPPRAELLSTWVARLVGWTGTVFFRTEVTGREVPPGPALIVANHPNSLLDPILVFRAAGRLARPLAKAPLFTHPLIGPVLKALGGLPVFRRQDDPELMHRNDRTFEAAIAALRAGEAVQIFPEGITHSAPSLAPLRTGAARLAFQAEQRAGWKLGLRVVPVGLIYRRKTVFRGTALVVVGEAFSVADRRADYERDPMLAVRALTDRIGQAIGAVTLGFAASGDEDLVDTAERLYARQRGWAAWRERERMGRRLPRLRRFQEGLAWLTATDPARHRRLARDVRRYRRLAASLGAGEAEVPPAYRPLDVLLYAVRRSGALGPALPFAALGAALWWLPYQVPRVAVRLARPEYEAIATYKLCAAVLAFPLALAAWVLLALQLAGPAAAALTAVAAPALGLVAVAWWERASAVLEDAVLFARAARRPRTRRRLARMRRRLAAEFDQVAERLESAAPRPDADRP